MPTSRRRFLAHAAAGSGAFVCQGVPLIRGLRPVSAQEAKITANAVQFQPEIEPLVRLLEETPRERVLEEFAIRIRDGVSYREILTALLLAGVRNVQPRPSVGFKFHAVLVVNSAHLASLSSPDQDRWLPIFWALDYFKGSQARDVQEGNWTMGSVDEAAVPRTTNALSAFDLAMDGWDEAGADAAVAGLARTCGAQTLFERFVRYGARDFRSIGHKAIFVANAFRTLQCIGWRYAEPVLRSLAYALLNHEGAPNPATSDLEADRPWRHNRELVGRIRSNWTDGRLDEGATSQLLSCLRANGPLDTGRQVIEMLNQGVSPQSVYDGLFLRAGEMLMRQPGIVALHASTTTNAMRFAFDASADDLTRRMLLLQNASFLAMFREAMKSRGDVGRDRIDELQPIQANDQVESPVQDVFQVLGEDRLTAARKLLAYLQRGASAEDFIHGARQLVFLKGTDSHDYKFSSAVLEDYYHVSPHYRDHFLAASVYKLRAAGDRDNGLVDRIRDVLA